MRRMAVSMLAAGAIVALAIPVSAAEQRVHKSYVCKYVGKPGVDERLQTGRNPIWVDNHALLGYDGTTYVGQEFRDAQGRSVVIVANTPKLDPEPTVADCPAAQTPTPSVSPTETRPRHTPSPSVLGETVRPPRSGSSPLAFTGSRPPTWPLTGIAVLLLLCGVTLLAWSKRTN
jgi:hypothetical protein